MKSRCASQALAWGLRLGGNELGGAVGASMAGLRADGVLGAIGAVLALAKSVDTCMAGFASHGLPCQPAVRTGTPALAR